ncbi:putative signal peptide protein [Puccinia sorghi]|uniref:Putative signal peptide protein n=1 Tax=Puccinia sorghi TaxID=27349 RepID=A0A0L6UD82_9BASI|nr:putative signal peptide protein [Puccinia sorghi]
MNLKCSFPFPFLCLFSFFIFNCSLLCFREYNFFDWKWKTSKYFKFIALSNGLWSILKCIL